MHLSEQTAVHRCQELLRARDGRNKLLHQCNRLKLLHITDRQNQNIHLLEAFHFKHIIIFNVVLLLYICFNKHNLSWNANAVKHWKSYPCSIFRTLCIPSPSIRNKTFFNTCESGFWNVILTVNSLPTTASSRGWNSTNTINGCRMKRERDLRARTEGMNFDVVCSSHKQSCDFRRHGI